MILYLHQSNINNQLGKILVIDDYERNIESIYEGFGINNDYSKEKHFLENMGDLSTAVPYRGQNLQTEETRLLKASVEKNIDLRDFDTNRIITNEEIGEMTQDEFIQNEDFINQQMKNGKIMSKAQAESKVQSGDLIWVDSYVRQNGTEVSGYYR